MLAQFPPEDLLDMREHDGQIAITCEFCSRKYRLGAFSSEVEAGSR
jgi:redox-regulated HSP33 family molecular chaperone